MLILADLPQEDGDAVQFGATWRGSFWQSDGVNRYLNFDALELVRLVAECRRAGWRYKLGAKPRGWNLRPWNIEASDCSGAVGFWLANMTGGALAGLVGMGSWDMENWARREHLKLTDLDNCKLPDGAVRWVFYPGASPGGTRHTALVWMGLCLECCGRVGVRISHWTGTGWQASCSVYVVTVPIP